MSVAALISVEEYLNTSFRPDCDYVDGEVLERNLGEFEHGSIQREVLFYLSFRYPALRKRLIPEQRVKVAQGRFRIPDVCLLAANAPYEKVAATPPELCIEILSPADSMSRILERVDDYFAMGVPVCWVIDPRLKQGRIATPGHLDLAVDGILRANGIEMPLAEVLPA